MKKILLMIAVAAVAGSLFGAAYQDQSTYANQDKREGLIVAHYSVARFGGTNASTGIDLGIDIPNNAIMLNEAVVSFTQAITPITASNSIQLCQGSSTTILYEVNAETSSVIVDVEYIDMNGLCEKSTTNMAIKTYFTGSVATQGAFMVYIPYIYGN